MLLNNDRLTMHFSMSFTFVTLLWISFSGCATPVTPPDDNGDENTTVSFSTQIQPIFTNSCAGCHSTGGIADLRGIALMLTAQESFAGLVNQPSVQDDTLTLVIPSDSASSLLIDKIESNSPPIGDRMPLFGPALSQEDIDLIKNWINQGAMNN